MSLSKDQKIFLVDSLIRHGLDAVIAQVVRTRVASITADQRDLDTILIELEDMKTKMKPAESFFEK